LFIPLFVGLFACSSGSSNAGGCANSTNWADAASQEGSTATIKGPVVDATYEPDVNGGPTFLDIGADYPDPSRFTVVIWQENRSNFTQAPEDLYSNATVCVTGAVQDYRGSPEIIVSSPDQITTP
jgi:hypothetical protein